MNETSKGILLGILVGEGHFGGDGKQPQVTVKMHIRHERLFHWLLETVPGSKLYGPYHHGGRNYYQWMVRGEALKRYLIPLLETLDLKKYDHYTFERYEKMQRDYGLHQSKRT